MSKLSLQGEIVESIQTLCDKKKAIFLADNKTLLFIIDNALNNHFHNRWIDFVSFNFGYSKHEHGWTISNPKFR